MTQTTTMSGLYNPTSDSALSTPQEQGVPRHGPVRKTGFEFIDSMKRSLTGKTISSKQMLVFTNQLSVMLGSGCDLCAGLDAMARQQSHPHFKSILEDLHNGVKQGQSFSIALARHPEAFSSLYVTMVRAGESAGVLRQMLAALQTMVRSNLRIISSIRGALMYPIILSLVAITAITVMTTFVLPSFAKIFRDSHVPLPSITAFVITTSEVLSHNFPWIVLGLITFALAFIWLIHRPTYRDIAHRWILKCPVIGQTLQLAYVCRTFQTLGILIKSGLPLADAIILTRDMMPNVYYWRFFDGLHTHIGEGKTLTADFETTTLFPPMATQMIAVGEQTGTLAQVSQEIASFHEEELQSRIKVLTTALEPIIIILLGIFVGGIAISVILPMFKLSNTIH